MLYILDLQVEQTTKETIFSERETYYTTLNTDSVTNKVTILSINQPIV